MGSSPLGGIVGFTQLVTLRPHGISQGAHKLAQTPMVIKKIKILKGALEGARCFKEASFGWIISLIG